MIVLIYSQENGQKLKERKRIMVTKNKGESYFTLDKFECYWEDAFMQIDWKNLDEAKLDTPQSFFFTQDFCLINIRHFIQCCFQSRSRS